MIDSDALKILTFGVILYLIWAILHHKRSKSLTFTIFMEYLLTAALSVVILLGVHF